MGLNYTKKYTQNYLDDYSMFLEQNPAWNPDGDNDITDCIGANAFAYLAYGDKRLLDAIKNCYVYKTDSKGKYIEPFRHPSYTTMTGYTNDMSRDHIIYTLGIMHYAGEQEFVKDIAKYLRWKFNSKFSMTVDLWLWMKGIAGNWFYMTLYYILEIPVMVISLLYSAILYKIANFGSELPQDQYKQIATEDKPKLQQFVLKIHFPFFAFCFSAYMNFTSKNNLGKYLLSKIYSLFIPKYNTYMKLINGVNVSKEEVYSYKSMTGTRWTEVLNNINDRDIHIITDPKLIEDNVIDVDLIRNLYEKTIK